MLSLKGSRLLSLEAMVNTGLTHLTDKKNRTVLLKIMSQTLVALSFDLATLMTVIIARNDLSIVKYDHIAMYWSSRYEHTVLLYPPYTTLYINTFEFFMHLTHI